MVNFVKYSLLLLLPGVYFLSQLVASVKLTTSVFGEFIWIYSVSGFISVILIFGVPQYCIAHSRETFLNNNILIVNSALMLFGVAMVLLNFSTSIEIFKLGLLLVLITLGTRYMWSNMLSQRRLLLAQLIYYVPNLVKSSILILAIFWTNHHPHLVDLFLASLAIIICTYFISTKHQKYPIAGILPYMSASILSFGTTTYMLLVYGSLSDSSSIAVMSIVMVPYNVMAMVYSHFVAVTYYKDIIHNFSESNTFLPLSLYMGGVTILVLSAYIMFYWKMIDYSDNQSYIKDGLNYMLIISCALILRIFSSIFGVAMNRKHCIKRKVLIQSVAVSGLVLVAAISAHTQHMFLAFLGILLYDVIIFFSYRRILMHNKSALNKDSL